MGDRRTFFRSLGACLVATGIPRPLTALAAAQSVLPVSFSAIEWRCAAALCAELIPTDESPGATEAGCVNFIDKALAAEDSAALPLYQAALAAVDGTCLVTYGKVFADLDAERRYDVLVHMEHGTLAGWGVSFVRVQDFFATIRFHTLLGFVADPRHGGNRDHAGWKLMGFPGPLHLTGGVTPEQMQGLEPVAPAWEPGGHGGHGSTSEDRR